MLAGKRNYYLKISSCAVAVLCLLSLTCKAVDFVYADADPLMGKDIPGLNLRVEDGAAYCCVQFGPNTNDLFYLVFDCARKYKAHDVMFVYVPGHETYGTPVLFKGSMKDGSMNFGKFTLQAVFGDVEVTYDIHLKGRTMWEVNRMRLTSEIECKMLDKKADEKCSFNLYGFHTAAVHANRKLEADHVLQTPSLSAVWDYRSDPPHVRGRVRMGKYGFMPDSGLVSRVKVVVTCEGSGSKSKKIFKMNPDGATPDFTYKPSRQLKKETPYTANVTVDLTPFWKELVAEATTVLR